MLKVILAETDVYRRLVTHGQMLETIFHRKMVALHLAHAFNEVHISLQIF